MKRLVISLFAMLLVLGASAQSREGLSEYTLNNGLKVLLWEDHDQPDVTGYIAVRAGSIDEPQEYTGLAHYLEHMLFKGTDKIGSLDWEKERPLYEKIIALYDEYATTTDPKRRDELTKQINEASKESAKLSTTEDFFQLMDEIGATDVNAFTSYDMTCYHNSFPANQMLKWLTIFSDRLTNPVFRTFQAELENVFEEYNMYEDGVSTQTQNILYSKLYEGHPYERNVIGKAEHLKNPRLSKLIEFYNTWYVPNNMALILVGDFSSEEVKPLIESTFGKFERKELPARTQYPATNFANNPKYSFKLGYYPQIVWGYNGVRVTDEDATALDFVCSLLSNGMSTGLLDKISMDGTVQGAGAECDSRRDAGRVLVYAVPYYDMNQQRYESNADTKKIIMAEINKLKTGEIPDWLITTVKEEYAQNYQLSFESSESKVMNLVQCFIYGLPLDDIFTENEKIQALTKEDIQRIAKKYFDADCITLEFEEGEPKTNKLAKPKIDPLDPVKDAVTDYAKAFRALPEGEVRKTFMDFTDVQIAKMDEHITLHHTLNTKNNIFSLSLRYGVGTRKMPMLEYAVDLMNTAGILPSTDNQQFRRQLAELGGRCAYSVSDSYFTVEILGNEEHIAEICQLVQRQMLFPKLDKKQLDNIISSEFMNRYQMTKVDEVQASALLEYVCYGKKSDYLDVVPFMDIYNATIPSLTAQFVNATEYDLNIFYVGQKSVADIKDILTANLPLKENMKASESPIVRDRVAYDKPGIYFLPNSNVQQATIYFYFEGQPYSTKDQVLFDAFAQYFDGGFTGLVLNEIRAKRSMAYTAYGEMMAGALPGKNASFMGYIGTQNDKVVDAVNVFMDLVNNMPEYPERIEAIKAALRQNYQIAKPSMRSKGETYDYWRMMGYTEDPARELQEAVDNLTFDQIVEFYKKNIQGKPMTIVIMGDQKMIDTKSLGQKYGKVVKVSKNKLFAPLEFEPSSSYVDDEY